MNMGLSQPQIDRLLSVVLCVMLSAASFLFRSFSINVHIASNDLQIVP
jgi:hypothetical protein